MASPTGSALASPLPSIRVRTRRIEDTLDRLKKTHTNELVFALCGPIGSPLHAVAAELNKLLTEKFDYECETIRLSEFIREHGAPPAAGISEYERKVHLIAEGDKLRNQHGKGVLANLGISRVYEKREEAKDASESTRFLPKRVCHIFDSIKNQQELDILRTVYGKLLFCIGVFSPLEFRVDNMKAAPMDVWEVYKLIDQDSGEEIEHGQTVRDTFPQADFFLKVDSKVADQTAEKVERLLNLITRVEICTPTNEENAMYFAASAGMNSACLSRQVGAAVTDKDGQILGVGWNDVPKFGGGLYGATEEKKKTDQRCMNLDGGTCFNDREKKQIARTAVKALQKAGILSEADTEKAVDTIFKSKVKDLIEFSRAVHAELHAIIHASQECGTQMRGGKLYCTTYPCHSCARHIIASGLSEVFYIEPYRKSLATSLHGDAITEATDVAGKVKLIPYEGVAPRRFVELFEMRPHSRKKDGKKISTPPQSAQAVIGVSLESFPVLEAFIVDELGDKGLIPKTAAPNEQSAS